MRPLVPSSAALVLLGATLLILFGPAARAPKRVYAAADQVTSTVTATWHGSWQRSSNFAVKDEVQMQLSETCTYNIIDWSDTGINLRRISCDTSWTASGGGSTALPEPMKNYTWQYAAVEPVEPLTEVSLDPETKTGGIDVGVGGVKANCSGQESGTREGLALTIAQMVVSAASGKVTGAGISVSGGPPLGEVTKFKFDPSNRRISGGNSVSYQMDWQESDGATGTGSFSLTYSVTGGAPQAQTEVELIVPAQYDHWLPQAGADEKTLGNYIDVKIVAHRKGEPGKAPPKKVRRYKILLEGTSREGGVDLNWPPKSRAKDDYDFRIDASNPWIRLTGQDGQSAETTEEDLDEFTVTVNSYDWGGFTTLRVVGELEDGSQVVGHLQGQPGRESLAIPRDDNHNHIADEWERWYHLTSTDASADEDSTPAGDGHAGDSIALYNEYRGFHIHGGHQRLSPDVKDLFIWDTSNLGPGIYPQATGVNVHLISAVEVGSSGAMKGNDNIVTPNGTLGNTYVLFLYNRSLGDGTVGETAGGPGVPSSITAVEIDAGVIASGYGARAADALRSTIAHELGHATNIWHHGSNDYSVGDVTCRKPDGAVVNHLCSSKPKGSVGKSSGDCFEVAAKGGKYSGNDHCLMRYDMTSFFEDPQGNCQWRVGNRLVTGSEYGADPPGTTVCDSPKGTGVNDASNPHNKAGDATKGDCIHQLCLKNGRH
jgi:hypothetical protein